MKTRIISAAVLVPILFVVVLAALCSVVFKYALPMVSGGFAVILSALAASVAAALLFPVEEEATA